MTGPVRSAASSAAERISNALAGFREHRFRRVAVVGLAAAVFTGSGATAAWAISNTEEGGRTETAAVESTGETTSEAATEEATSEDPTEEATTEEATEEATTEEDTGPVVLDEGTAGLDSEQLANAVTVIETGDELGFDEDGWAVALATAMQEAKLYNAASDAVPESWNYTDSDVHYEDHDSVGIFQQRTSMGWGSVEELMDVSTSAGKFYNTLADVDGWEDMSVAEAAQAVQVSAYPDYYAQWEDDAWEIIDAYESAS